MNEIQNHLNIEQTEFINNKLKKQIIEILDEEIAYLQQQKQVASTKEQPGIDAKLQQKILKRKLLVLDKHKELK